METLEKAKRETAVAVLLHKIHETLELEVEDYLRSNGLSRTQFAEKLGVSKGYLSQFLNGKSDHKLSSIAAIGLAIDKYPHLVFSEPPKIRPYRFPENLPAVLAEDPTPYGNPAFLQGVDLKELNALSILADLDKLKESIDQFRPFSEQVAYQLMQKFRYAWNYHSNAIEGNQLTYGETLTLIMNGLTAKGKPLKDHLDVQGHEKAVDLMLEMVKGSRKVSQYDIRQLHQLLLKETYQQSARTQDGERVFRTIHVGEYKRQPNHVRTADGGFHYYADPRDVPHRMAVLLDWYDGVKGSELVHPLVVASIFHHEFVAIHPFDDGNGRMGRILMNFTLMRQGYPPIVIAQQKRLEYYNALNKADFGDFLPLTKYLANGLKQSLGIQLDGVSNGNIQPYRWPDTK